MSAVGRSEVAIVGGGPAGAALAIRLAGQGIDVTMFERDAAPRWHASGVYSSPRTRERLSTLGLGAHDLDRLITPIMAMEVTTLTGATCRLEHRAPGACGIDRVRLEQRLLDRAIEAGADVRRGVVVRGIDLDAGRLDVSSVAGDAGPTIHRAALVVGADGPRSVVARAAGVDRTFRLLSRAGLTMHVAMPGPDMFGAPDVARMIVGNGWYCGLAPVPSSRLNVGLVVPSDALQRIGHGPGAALDFVGTLLGRLPGTLAELRRAPTTDGLRICLPLAHRPRRLTGRGWLLVGDAAGFLDPLSGEGLHRAFVSAEMAANAILAHRGGRTASLERYDHRMSTRFRGKDIVSLMLQSFLARPALADRAIRRLALREDLGQRLGAVLADQERPSTIVDPRYLARLLTP